MAKKYLFRGRVYYETGNKLALVAGSILNEEQGEAPPPSGWQGVINEISSATSINEQARTGITSVNEVT